MKLFTKLDMMKTNCYKRLYEVSTQTKNVATYPLATDNLFFGLKKLDNWVAFVLVLANRMNKAF